MVEKKFDPQKLEKLNNPVRINDFPIDFIIDQAAINNPKTIVDIGAGTGFFSIPFANRFNDCKIVACDISEVMIEWMNENVVTNFSNIMPVKMEENKTELDDNMADFLFMVNLHHELHNPELLLKECYRILKSGSSIAISDWRKKETKGGPPLSIRCEPDQVSEQLMQAGFKGIKIFEDFPNNFIVIARKN